MHVMFIHNAFPGHFGALAAKMIKLCGAECSVAAHGCRPEEIMGVNVFPTDMDPSAEIVQDDGETSSSLYELRRRTRTSVVATEVIAQVNKNIPVDLIVVHADWGSSSTLRRYFPDTPIITYLEQYIPPGNTIFDFITGNPEDSSIDRRLLMDAQNMNRLYDVSEMDAAWVPSAWTKSCLPGVMKDDPMIYVQHEGIDTQFWQRVPREEAITADLPDAVKESKKLVTYVNRSFEVAKGFDIFMQAAKEIYQNDPDVHFACVGRPGEEFNEKMSDEVQRMSYKDWVLEQDEFDLSRFSFIDRVDSTTLASLLSLSKCHVYLSAPMILGWSVFNTMACGTPIVASRTGSIPEVVKHGENGFTPPFFDWKLIADSVLRVVNMPEKEWLSFSRNARDTIELQYDFRITAPRIYSFFEDIVAGKGRPQNRDI